MQRPFSLLVFLICFTSSATASSTDQCEKEAPGFNFALRLSCEAEQIGSECREWFQKNPGTLKYAKDCQNGEDSQGFFSAAHQFCKEAFGEAWGGIWKTLLTNGQKNSAFFASCDADETLACKKQLALESYYEPELRLKAESDPKSYEARYAAKLNEASSFDLARKRDNVRMLARRDSNYRKQLEQAGVPLPEADGIADINIPVQAIFSSSIESLKSMKVKWQCYTPAARARLLCYAAGLAADPALLVGGVTLGTLKGAEWASAVLNGARASKLASSELAAASSAASKVPGATSLETIAAARAKPIDEVIPPVPRTTAPATEAAAVHPAAPVSASAPSTASNTPALVRLQQHLDEAAAKGKPSDHMLYVTNGKGHLHIGNLNATSDTFMIAAYEAVREGSITSINAGMVVGPKVLPMLSRLAKAAPEGKRLVITGTTMPSALLNKAARNLVTTPSKNPVQRVEELTKAELAQFKKAADEVGMLKACATHFPGAPIEDCGMMTFSIDTSKANPFHWEKGSFGL